jgi:hypothetical protein
MIKGLLDFTAELLGKTTKELVNVATDVVDGIVDIPSKVIEGYDKGFFEQEQPKEDTKVVSTSPFRS